MWSLRSAPVASSSRATTTFVRSLGSTTNLRASIHNNNAEARRLKLDDGLSFDDFIAGTHLEEDKPSSILLGSKKTKQCVLAGFLGKFKWNTRS